jgi:hypothetical protein
MGSYIAHPYWPEKELVISIELKSGVNRLKLEDKKRAALKSQCEKEGISIADYHKFVEMAARPWYRVDNDDLASPIIIPRHQLAGCLVETIGRTPKAVHGKYNADSFRHHVQVSDFVTDRTEKDGVFDRYVKLEGSNKRDHQVNECLRDFVATGTLSVASDAKSDDLRRLLTYALEEVGVGASRKMGFGFGELAEFEDG